MDYEPNQEERLLEAMEIYRSGIEDSADPLFSQLSSRLSQDSQLKARYERLHRADALVQDAFYDVAIPAGLAERILQSIHHAPRDVDSARCVTAASLETILSDATTCQLASADAASAQPAKRRVSRRGLLVAIASLSTAAALMAAVLVNLQHVRPDTPSTVLERTLRFFSEESHEIGSPLDVAPADSPFSRDLIRLQGIRWRPIGNLLGGSAVAYDLPGQGGSRATLYVMQRTVPGLPAFPPSNPTCSTAGNSAAAWQVGNTLYVFVIEGDSRQYRGYLDLSRGPVT